MEHRESSALLRLYSKGEPQVMQNQLRQGFRRTAALAVFASALLLPGSAFAAQTQSPPGTVVGSVTCGDEAITPAANAIVTLGAGTVETRTEGTGRFTLSNVPSQTSFTVDAMVDSQAGATTSRYNVSVQPGETLDIGNLDLAVCPQPATAPQDDTPSQQDNPNG
jgi:hypothetical protein